MVPHPRQRATLRKTSCVGGAREQAFPVGSLASQSTLERLSKAREGKTAFDLLLRQYLVQTLKRKSRKRVEQPRTSNINGTSKED